MVRSTNSSKWLNMANKIDENGIVSINQIKIFENILC